MAEREAVDPGALGAWLAAHVDGASGGVRVDQLAGGSSNLTFRVRDGVNDWVLRSPPLRHVLATAHNMKREYTVQTALRGTDVPVPRMVDGDYSFTSTRFRRDDPARMLAVLDWERSALGDPLTDVGMLASYWSEVGELLWRRRSPQPHQGPPGFGSVDVLIDRYAAISGRDVAHLDFYRALATFKLACIAEGSHARRVKAGETDRIADADDSVRALAGLALHAARS